MSTSRPLHVLHVIDGLGLGGGERMLVDIANRTIADGHRVSVCVTRTETTVAGELDPRIEKLVLGRTRRFSPRALATFVQFIRRNAVDVLHVHLRSNLAFVLQVRAPRLITTPIVFHDHYGTIEIDTRIPPWFRIGHHFVERYVGVYERLAEWAQRAGMAPARTTTIPNALDLERLRSATPLDMRAELKLAPDTLLGIVVATLRSAKGIELLLEALARSQTRGRLHVMVVGADGPADYTARIKAMRSELGLESIVTFLGGRTDVPRLLPAADLALLASHTESGPLVLVEYLAAELPIVSTRVGDIGRRLAAMGVPGFVAARDVDAFAREIDTLVALSPEDRAARAAIGSAALRTGWDIRLAMPRWYEVYREAIAASSASTSSR